MVFKRMLGAFGDGGPSVGTLLAMSRTQPGGTLSGEVRLKGGDHDARVERIGLGLVARVEPARREGGEQSGLVELAHAEVSGPSTLGQGQDRTIAFQVAVPWETPISEIGGRHLAGLALGVRTEVVSAAMVVEQGDLDMVAVRPLPSQQRVLHAFAQLGFHFVSAVLRAGGLAGVRQDLPFYQGIEFYPPTRYAGSIHEVELAFVPSPSGLDVVLTVNGHAGRHWSGGAVGRFQMTHAEALRTDWPSEVDRWLGGLTRHARG
ncbi:sporulation protein [Nonomuraea zeae]|uniref:Sporulation protein n=1 Tax=Nonomuraea zeae TaxID=1642303 RepID=A0A5S4GP05_9ACTN|nr:sporulation protein [Nonomuraea zeae]TMR34234.1 sporulation protein [Nonomuraea zeae]